MKTREKLTFRQTIARLGWYMRPKWRYLYIFLVLYWTLTSLDLLTTYIGVCRLGGVELVASAIKTGTRYGFFYMTFTHYSRYAILAYAFALLVTRITHKLGRIIVIGYALVLVVMLVQVVAFNMNSLIYMLTGVQLAEPSSIASVPENATAIMREFEQGDTREQFCRLI